MNARPLQILVVYASALLQGLAMVSFPASSAELKMMKGLTDAQYGLLFLPQIATAIAGSLAGGNLARKIGLKNLLWVACAFAALSQIGLASVAKLSSSAVLPVLLASTASFGLAFGLAAAPLNTYPGLLFPSRRDTALVALHTVLGMGLATGPVVTGWFIRAGTWVAFPLTLLGAGVTLAVAALACRLPAAAMAAGPGVQARRENPLASAVLWTFVALVILYAFAEGTFANWSVIYLHEERQIAPATAALGLSVFWAMMAAGRLLVSALLLRVPAAWIWLALPVLMAAAFLLLPLVNGAASGIVAFAFAGLACSAFFPVSVSLISRRFDGSTALVSSLMIAALMIGVGTGSFVVGPLRAALPLERLYRVSTLYPAAVLLMALVVLKRGCLQAKQGIEA